MNDEASVHLQRLLKEKGLELIDHPQRCRGLILDNCVGFRAEANALISALDNGIPRALLSASTGAPRKATVSALARRLQSDMNMDAQAARWAVESWAGALSTTPASSSEVSAAATEAINEAEAPVSRPESAKPEPAELPNKSQAAREVRNKSTHPIRSERNLKNATRVMVPFLLSLLVISLGAWYFLQGQAGKPLVVLKGTGNMVKALSWAPDGQRLASADASGRAAVWDTATSQELVSLEVDDGTNLITASWSPDARRLATGNKDGTIKIWDAVSGKQLLTIGGKSSPTSSSASDFFAKVLAASSTDSRVLRMAWSPDGKRLAAGHQDGSAEVWDPATGKVLDFLNRHSGASAPAESVAWGADGQRVAVGYGDGSVIVWDPGGEKQLSIIRASRDAGVSSLAWSPNGQDLATIDGNGAGEIWDATTGSELIYLNYKQDLMTRSLAWSPGGHRLAVGYDDGSLSVWDIWTAQAGRDSSRAEPGCP